MEQLIVHTEIRTPRLEYVVELLFSHLLHIPYRLCGMSEAWDLPAQARIYYGRSEPSGFAVWIPDSGLLRQEGIRRQQLRLFYVQDLPAYFRADEGKADLPFDLFSLVFYLVSRYEEYLPHRRDAHDRYPAGESLAFRDGFLEQPLVNQWANRLGQLLQRRAPELKIQVNHYQFRPTYDIDLAWAYLHRPGWRQLASGLRDLLSIRGRQLGERIRVLRHHQADPYDTFAWLKELHSAFRLEPAYFFLLADWSQYDRNISHRHPAMRRLIRDLDRGAQLGIHPSYQHGCHREGIVKEKQRLEEITGRPISRSRQHYLRLQLPQTYQHLLAAGLHQDYTMGFPDQVGFRASIALPFPWYDLSEERQTELIIHPFQAMDVTLRQYLALRPQEISDRLAPLIRSAKEVGGVFCTLWHNSSLSPLGGWTGWRQAYHSLITRAVS